MKHIRRLIQISVFTFTVTFACISYAGIANTVHNMSTSGTGTIKATTEQEICAFCHIPHNVPSGSTWGRPLWNHDMPTTGYTMYSSDYLTRAGYTQPTGLGTTTGTPGMLSRQCLSCHDGTVAVGAVYAVRGTIYGATLIAMAPGGLTGSGTMLTTDVGYIGTNLTTHHPVGIVYNSTLTIPFGSGSRSIELSTTPNTDRTQPLPIVYTIGATQYVECSSCHDPHTQNKKFLRTTGTSLAAQISATCTSCHTKTGWSGSIHQTSGTAYSDATVNTTFGANTVASLACMNCHRTHKGLGAPYLQRQVEATTCFQGASGLTTETACHGSSSTAKNIQTAITRTYKHPATTIIGVHTDLDVLYPTAVGKGLDWADSRHATCVDCHNPHRATSTPARVGATAWYPSTVASTSNLTANSGALTGVSGVQPTTWPSLWAVPTAFTTQESSAYEYQICFKCHTYYALQAASGISVYTTASGIAATDQAMEFNPNNKSAHPVAVTLNNQTGSYAPKPLAATQMSAPWTVRGNQTMYCSDCHGADNEASGDPKGPHGSSYKYLLKGANKYWPVNASAALYTLGNNNATDANLAGLFCRNCHPLRAATSNTWYNNVHLEHSGPQLGNVACVACHLAVPHGGKRSRLIGYASDVSPYNYNPTGTYTTGKLSPSGFKKAATPTGYQKSDCYSTVAGCTTHGAITGADP